MPLLVRSALSRLSLALGLAVFFPVCVVAEEPVRITNGEWLPFFSESLKDFGRPSKLVADAFALEGVKVEYSFFPWKRSYKLSEQGRWDGTIGWPVSEERQQTHYYSKIPVDSGAWVLFHLKDTKLESGSLEDLKKYKFGVTLGEWALDGDDPLTQALREKALDYQITRTDEQSFLMLLRKRIDAFPQQREVGKYQIQQLVENGQISKQEAAKIVHIEKPYRNMPLYLLLSKKKKRNKHLIEAFDKGMLRLQQDSSANSN